MKIKNAVITIVCLALPLLVGGISGWATASETSGTWYRELAKPPLQPPNWVFGPVWTGLYILMGISLVLLVRKWTPANPNKWAVFELFAVQLLLNGLWSFLFFKFHLLKVSAVEILLLWVAIVLFIDAARKVSPLAAILQLPYLAWVTFASYLTIAIAILNR